MSEIRSRPVTAEYESGFERTFGERPRREGRQRFVLGKDGKLHEVSSDWEPSQRRVPVVGDSHYDGMRAQDGADISSRRKHREYMHSHGVTTVDDFKQTWAKAAEERAAPKAKDTTRREDIGRAFYELADRRH